MRMSARAASWMAPLSDDMLISDINIPGSHDCAAISTLSRGIWDRHDFSVSEQLLRGIRLLDVRIAIIKKPGTSIELGSDGYLHLSNGQIAKGLFVEIRPNVYLPQQSVTTETFYDLKCSLQPQINVPISQMLLVDIFGQPLEDSRIIKQWWSGVEPQIIVRLLRMPTSETLPVSCEIYCDYDSSEFVEYEFLTLHGKGNYYQSFPSLMNECREFLQTYPTEFLVVNFQIDEGEPSPHALHMLKGIISPQRYPFAFLNERVISHASGPSTELPSPTDASQSLPHLREVRGKMFLFNRINEDYTLGVPLSLWADPEAGQNQAWIVGNVARRDGFAVYVQDKFQGFGGGSVAVDRSVVEEEKFQLVKTAIDRFNDIIKDKADGRGAAYSDSRSHILMNYASVSNHEGAYNTKSKLIDHFITTRIPQHRLDCGLFHSKSMPPRDISKECIDKFGWLLFDYPFDTYAINDEQRAPITITTLPITGETAITIVDIIISSNFSYMTLPLSLRLPVFLPTDLSFQCPAGCWLAFEPVAIASVHVIDKVYVPPDNPQIIRVCIDGNNEDVSADVASYFVNSCLQSSSLRQANPVMVGCQSDNKQPFQLRFAIRGRLRLYSSAGAEVACLDNISVGQGVVPNGGLNRNNWWIGGSTCRHLTVQTECDSLAVPWTSSSGQHLVCFRKSMDSPNTLSVTFIVDGASTTTTTMTNAIGNCTLYGLKSQVENNFTWRVATLYDISILTEIMNDSISVLLANFLSTAQVNASFEFMGLDSKLIEDGTYYVICDGNEIIGCGGWSRRSTLFGGNHTIGRDETLLDPTSQAARIRAMYTKPSHSRRGVGRMIIKICEESAQVYGFRQLELMATLAGEQLYKSCGYEEVSRTVINTQAGIAVPVVKMTKFLSEETVQS